MACMFQVAPAVLHQTHWSLARERLFGIFWGELSWGVLKRRMWLEGLSLFMPCSVCCLKCDPRIFNITQERDQVQGSWGLYLPIAFHLEQTCSAPFSLSIHPTLITQTAGHHQLPHTLFTYDWRCVDTYLPISYTLIILYLSIVPKKHPPYIQVNMYIHIQVYVYFWIFAQTHLFYII